jgi:predicted nucleic acid-binding protein
MILADTSVWIDHFTAGDPNMASLLENRQIAMHPFVIGELALGYLDPRDFILEVLHNLDSVEIATADEVLDFIESNTLAGAGIGYVDAHLLVSVRLSSDTALWTRDGNLAATARKTGVALAR